MSTTSGTLSADEQRLAELGYKQELKRGWSGFSNFAISFSIISVLAGCFTTYGQAFKNGGPIAISIMWPVISVLVLMVAFSMSELACGAVWARTAPPRGPCCSCVCVP
jgi:amino acid permease